MADEFGQDMIAKHEFTEKLHVLASTKVRFLLNHLLQDGEYAEKVEEGNYSFMRTTPAFKKAMVYAKKEWGWERKLLRG